MVATIPKPPGHADNLCDATPAELIEDDRNNGRASAMHPASGHTYKRHPLRTHLLPQTETHQLNFSMNYHSKCPYLDVSRSPTFTTPFHTAPAASPIECPDTRFAASATMLHRACVPSAHRRILFRLLCRRGEQPPLKGEGPACLPLSFHRGRGR